MIDYRTLLVKYMRIVEAAEGVTFVPISGRGNHFLEDDLLSEDEWQELRAIDAQIRGRTP
jgi:hypothetical protein